MNNEEQAFEMGATVILGIVILGVLAWVGTGDYQDEVEDQAYYCEMVETWKADAKRGVAPADRAGWPDYQNNYNEVCK